MKSFAVKSLATAVPVFASPEAAQPLVQSVLAKDNWGNVELLIGFAWGLYVPFR